MPLIILSGYPSSGLTYRATQLHTLLEQTQDSLFANGTIPPSNPRYKVVTVATHDATDTPRSVYDHARSEKMARGVAFARAKRALSRDTVVILDGMNYIKGVRYQLWCEAKAVGTTCCVVHVGTPVDTCIANNQHRLEAGHQAGHEAYTPDLLENLIFRYEEPSSHSRWDQPLFTVPWSDPEPPVREIWTALTGIPVSTNPNTTTAAAAAPTDTADPATPAAAETDTGSVATGTATATATATRTGVKIKPHAATLQPSATTPTALYDLEKRTSAVIAAIRAFTQSNPSASAVLASQSAASPGDGHGIIIPIPDAEAPIFIPAHIAFHGSSDDLAGPGAVLALPRLQRLKRQWIGLNRAYIGGNYAVGMGAGGLRPEQVGDAFVRFLNDEFAG